MTCIAGVVRGEDVWLACDSYVLSGETLRHDAEIKLFRCGPLLMGGAGSRDVLQCIAYRWVPPPRGDQETMEYLVCEVMTSLRAHMEAADLLVEEQEGKRMDASLLFAYEGQLFRTDHYFSVNRCADNYCAVGAGELPALGALYATPNSMPRKRLILALEAAAHSVNTVYPPYHILKL